MVRGRFDAGTVQMTSTLIRARRTPRPWTQLTLPLPVSAVAVLRRRHMTGARLDQPLLPDVLGFRDPANVRRELRQARGTEALAWITSHSFRTTAATILDDAALSARLVADQLGHSRPSMTQDYMGRRAIDSQAAAALEAALGEVRCRGPAVTGARADGAGNEFARREPIPWQDLGRRRRSDTVWVTDLGFGAPSGTRTPNPLIKSQLLCQLS